MSKCLVCESTGLRKIISFDRYPLCIGVLPPKLRGKVKSFPLKIGWCSNCGLIQQINPILDELKRFYRSRYYGLLSSVATYSKTEVGSAEIQKYFSFFKGCNLPQGKVLDIGCNDGYLLSLIRKEGYEVWGIDPNPSSNIAEEQYKIPIIRDFFSEKYFRQSSFDIIILRNLLEHIFELNDFLVQVNRVLKPSGYIIVEVPSVSCILRMGGLGSFFHQHLSYFSLDVLLNLLSKHSLEYVDSREDYFIYLCARKITAGEKRRTSFKKRSNNRTEEIKRYFSEYKKIKQDMRKLLKPEDNVAVFGAGGHTTGLVHMLGRQLAKKIKYVYDNNPVKYGNLLADLPVMVRSPESIKVDKPDLLVISTGIFETEILNQVKKMNIPGLKIAVIYPKVKIES